MPKEKSIARKKAGRKPKAAKIANRGKPGRPANHPERKQVKGTAGKGRGKRYSGEARKELLAKYESYRKDGLTAQDAARKVGTPYITLRKWQTDSGIEPRRRGRPPKADKVMRGQPGRRSLQGPSTVQVDETGMIVLVTPSGFRIEAISPNDLIRLLEALR